jgi:hypothetical protein
MNPRQCPGPISRRSFLTIGTLGLTGLTLGDVLRLRAQAPAAQRPVAPDTSVIFIWLPGGPPHMETYDLKPDAPSEYRGDFRPIHTNVPGIDVCELMPLHARCADKYVLVRSVAHTFADHGGGHKRVMTGRLPATPTETVNDAPAVGSIVAKMRERVDVGLPNYVAGVDQGRQGIDVFAMGPAYLGPRYVPFMVVGDPSRLDFQVRNIGIDAGMAQRLDDRLELLRSFDSMRRDLDASGTAESMDSFNQQALGLMTSSRAREAFDLSREPAALRDRYGRNAWGQRAILSRRLVEAGCSFVTMVLENPHVDGCLYNWDSHAVNTHLFNDARGRLPVYDRAITALVEDLHARGLTEKVLLVVTGEFGRTPRLSYDQANGGRPGRDHWPSAMSMLLCGGGMRHGQLVGSTNARGEHPHSRPLTPNDLWATVYHHLGINTDHPFPDHTGRPMPILPFGEPIRELV